jgi:hypothetical protein
MICDYHVNTVGTVIVIICAIVVSSQCIFFICKLLPCTFGSTIKNAALSTGRYAAEWAGEYLLVIL